MSLLGQTRVSRSSTVISGVTRLNLDCPIEGRNTGYTYDLFKIYGFD